MQAIMNAPSPPSPDGNVTGADLACEMCGKSYLRRDLLMRHRRRCRIPKKPINRRKACDACVKARTKCCYSQPSCVRCTKRGTQCVYSASAPPSTSNHSEPQSQYVDDSDLSPPLSSSETDNFATSTQPPGLDDAPAWGFSASLYPLEAFDYNMADLPNTLPVTLPSFTATQPLTPHDSPGFTPSTGELSGAASSQFIPSAPSTQPLSDSTSPAPALSSSSASLALVRVICDYPSLLMKGSFVSPFLHTYLYSLYSNLVPDMTFLPQTSMAICCGGGLNIPESNRFYRRALDAARQRLIGTWESYKCMQKWDALHAMLIYEALDLRESVTDDSTMKWRHNPRVTGMGSPFLVKMAGCFAKSYPELLNHDINVFSDPKSLPDSENTSKWSRWRITETARRTMFFANILNFYSNRNHTTGKQSPYYTALNDELILNMPLPCNEAVWSARSEEDWLAALKKASHLSEHGSSGPNSVGYDALFGETTLKSIFSKFNNGRFQAEMGASIGFGDSDELRRLIILCATAQFS